ncbi:hypothetical protein ACWCPS_33110 [Streptomyces mauvecolor]
MNSPHPQTHRPRPVWPLALSTALLACGGLALLLPSPHPTAPVTTATRTQPSPTVTPRNPAESHRTGPLITSSAAPSRAASPSPSLTALSAVPPRGDGPASDPAIQQLLDQSWPRDLPKDDEQQLLATGRRLLAADASGVGRDAFPTLFPPGERSVVVPAFTRIRIQAAIARTDPGHPDRAVVHLVWAGADRGGTSTDGRITDLSFTRTPSPNGATVWMPMPLS